MAIKKSKRGGKRPGAGAKKTGRNTVNISFCVHKDCAELIKEMVYSKLKELKTAKDGIGLSSEDFAEGKNIAVVDPGPVKKQESCMEVNKRISETPSFKKAPAANTDYLKSRRSKKLGLK